MLFKKGAITEMSEAFCQNSLAQSNIFYLRNYFSLNFLKSSRYLKLQDKCREVLRRTIEVLCEKCPNTEIFLVRIFLYSVRVWTLFTQWD